MGVEGRGYTPYNESSPNSSPCITITVPNVSSGSSFSSCNASFGFLFDRFAWYPSAASCKLCTLIVLIVLIVLSAPICSERDR